MKLALFDTPAFMPDFDKIEGQRQQWSNAISGWIDEAIQIEQNRFDEAAGPGVPVQFYNAVKNSPEGLALDQDIIWNAFPRTLRLGYGTKEKAFEVAEQLFSLTSKVPGLPLSDPFFTDDPGKNVWNSLFYRPLDEYCEFRVERNQKTKKITKITFTSEPPEFWQALHGDTLMNIQTTNFVYPFTGDRKLMLELYRKFISPKVELSDLECQQDYYSGKQLMYHKGDYNPYNRWNTTDGIMHLSHPSNYIAAEILLGADATILRHKNGKPVVQADALVCCAGYGGSNRTSDPTIGASVNDLTRLGAWITLKNPIGLYMHDLNTEGFTKPNGERIDPKEYFKVLRGNEKLNLIERAVFEVPAKEGFTVGDLKIGGTPIDWGGQVAEHINIKITGAAVAPGHFKNPMLECANFCCINEKMPLGLTLPMQNGTKIPQGYQEVFLNEQGTFGSAGDNVAAPKKQETFLAEISLKQAFPHLRKR